jgi:riboflavin synthase
MFTGIIEERGRVLALDAEGDSARITVEAPLAVSDARHGDSISVDGVCLTVVAQTPEGFTADVMRQTLVMSSLGDRLGGHIVQGHVDGTGRLLATTPGEAWRILRFSLPADLSPLVVDRGSITVQGVSLTVSAVSPTDTADADAWFEVSLIPETLSATTLGALEVGDEVNLETDVLARHVQRMLALDARDRDDRAGDRS